MLMTLKKAYQALQEIISELCAALPTTNVVQNLKKIQRYCRQQINELLIQDKLSKENLEQYYRNLVIIIRYIASSPGFFETGANNMADQYWQMFKQFQAKLKQNPDEHQDEVLQD